MRIHPGARARAGGEEERAPCQFKGTANQVDPLHPQEMQQCHFLTSKKKKPQFK